MTVQPNGPGLAVPADMEQLADIWEKSFHDTSAYIHNFLTLCGNVRNTAVFREDGRVVAAAYLLESTLHIGDEAFKAYYFYAAATHPEHRRKGYMEQIIRFCRALCEERDVDFLVLVPAGNDLYQYYSRFGFRANFYLKTTRLTPEQLQALAEKLGGNEDGVDPAPADFTPVPFSDIRNQALAGGSYLEFPAKTLQYMLYEHAYCRGKTILNEDGYVLYSTGEDEAGNEVLTVKELCAAGKTGTLLKELLKVEADYYVLNLPAFDPIRGGKTSTGRAGMDLAVTKRAVKAERTMKNAYIGLTLG